MREQSFPGVEVGIAPEPGPAAPVVGASELRGFALYLTNGEDPAKIEAAYRFATWLSEPAQQAAWHLATGSIPARASLADDPAVQARWNERPVYRVIFDDASGSTLPPMAVPPCSGRTARSTTRSTGRSWPPPIPPAIQIPTKNRRERVLALDDLTSSMLRAQVEMLERRAALSRAELLPDAYVFSDDIQGAVPWKPDAVSQYFGRLRARAGLTHVDFHDLRRFIETYGQDGIHGCPGRHARHARPLRRCPALQRARRPDRSGSRPGRRVTPDVAVLTGATPPGTRRP